MDFQGRLSSEKLSVEKKERAVEEISDNEPVRSACQKRAFLASFDAVIEGIFPTHMSP